MITVLAGENSFAVREALTDIIRSFHGAAERFDGTSLEPRDMPDLMAGNTLFATERLIIIRGLSENSAVWPGIVDWIGKTSDSTHVVLVEEKLDKRTSIYKALKAGADLKEFALWTDRDRGQAEKWVVERAGLLGLKLDARLSRHLVDRVGLDQWLLASALDKLSLLDTVTAETIDEHIELAPSENIFQLFDLALDGKRAEVHRVLATLQLTEDPYATFALLSSQAFQLAAVTFAKAGDDPAKDMAVHPFVVSKLQRHARSLGPRGAKKVLVAFADTDEALKSTSTDPWLLIEKTLLEISQ